MGKSKDDGVAEDGSGKEEKGGYDWRVYIETGNSLDEAANEGISYSTDKGSNNKSTPKRSSSSGGTKGSTGERKSKKASKVSDDVDEFASSDAGSYKTSFASKQSLINPSEDDHKNKLSSKSNKVKGSKQHSKTKSVGKISKKSKSASNKAKV